MVSRSDMLHLAHRNNIRCSTLQRTYRTAAHVCQKAQKEVHANSLNMDARIRRGSNVAYAIHLPEDSCMLVLTTVVHAHVGRRWSEVLSSVHFDSGAAQFRWHVEELTTWLFARTAWLDGAMAAEAAVAG